jgi:DNA-binding response OmpR family regulator
MERRVLVVDDNDDVRELLIHILRAEGLSPFGAADAVSALAILNSNPMDLILLDVMMPGISGVELLLKIRATESAYQNIPIAMITALSAHEEVARAIEAGASTYLVKPFRGADIRNLLARVFEGSIEIKERI